MNTFALENKFDLETVGRFALNYFSTMFIIVVGFVFYTMLSSYHMRSFAISWEPQIVGHYLGLQISTKAFWRSFVYIYAVALIPFFLINHDRYGKGFLTLTGFVKCFSKRFGVITPEEKQAMLSTGVKFFFVPFILNAFLAHCRTLNYKIVDLCRWLKMDDFDRAHFIPDVSALYFHIALAVLYFVEIVPFVVGYLVESRTLNNKTKSVEDTWSGWFFCLACYAPFNSAVASFFTTNYSEYIPAFQGLGQFGVVLQMTLNFVALLSVAAYVSASVSLGWKASNLTSRGVVKTGLYRYVRHPSYLFKNVAWWLFSIGFAIHSAIAGNPFVWHLVALAVWNWIYYRRALTEELHLARTDPEYLTYMQEVPYRFIPKII